MIHNNPNAEHTPDYYDGLYRRKARYRCDPYKSSFAPLWARALRLVVGYSPRAVVDIGCGSGQFAQMLDEWDIWGTGYDFSKVGIGLAMSKITSWAFEQADVTAITEWPDCDCFTCLDVLEHLQDDLGLLASLPRGVPVVFSVPTYPAAGHFRHFDTCGDVLTRYNDFVGIDVCEGVADWILASGIVL